MTAKPIASLFDQVDDSKRLKEAIGKLAGDMYVEDEDLRRELRIGPERWKVLTVRHEFESNRFQLPNRKVVWIPARQRTKLVSMITLTQDDQ